MTVANAKRDYYEVLGVDRDATPEEIKKAYRRLAHRYHPDRNSDVDAEARFKEAAEAYEVLADSAKRQRYDQFGHAGVGGVHDFSHMDVGDIFSMFTDIFGGGFGGGRSRGRGADLQTQVDITMLDVLHGTECPSLAATLGVSVATLIEALEEHYGDNDDPAVTP